MGMVKKIKFNVSVVWKTKKIQVIFFIGKKLGRREFTEQVLRFFFFFDKQAFKKDNGAFISIFNDIYNFLIFTGLQVVI